MPTDTATVKVILQRLHRDRPDARYELDWTTPLELLVATILAAQCTDERVNRATPPLFQRYRSARDYADADTAELEELIKSTGFFRQKAKTIQSACRVLADRFRGEVPRTMADLVTLPGVARKTANVVLNTAFGIPSGIIVDTHVARVAPRMGLTREHEPDRIEQDLMRLVPEREWTFFGPAMVLHGRYTCTARSPKCGACPLADLCDKRLEPGVAAAEGEGREMSDDKDEAPAKKRAGKGGAKAKAPAPARRQDDGGAAEGALPPIPASWREALEPETHKPYWAELERFLAEERKHAQVFPPQDEIFAALSLTPLDDVKVVLLGQDPYHDDGQAHGLCFSVRPGVPPPPSLKNMYKELQSDVGFRPPKHGSLIHWAKQGVLLLNAVLTVRAHEPNSHKGRGWETFTDAVLRAVADRSDRVVFVLWGAYAQKKAKAVDLSRHTVLAAAHPSPLSAQKFFGSRPFSAINDALLRAGKSPIDWQLPD